jgi:acyl-CoA synthetase (AMP-forming)/AMP-acid ligase II
MDKDGYVYLVDRVKDMIISGGENVYPKEVERVLEAHPAIAEAAVFGLPDDLWGETVGAVVVLRENAMLTAGDVVDYCAAQMAGFKKPRRVWIRSELPRNASGKVLKYQLREALRAEAGLPLR